MMLDVDVDVDILLTKSTIDFSMRVAKSSRFAPSRQPMTTRSGHRENYALKQWYHSSRPFIVVFYPFTTTNNEVFHCPCSLSDLEYYPCA